MFVLVLIPLSLILRKVKAAYEISESKEKINHLLFMDDLKLKLKGLDSIVQTVHVFSEDIGMEFGIEKCAKLVMEKGNSYRKVCYVSDGVRKNCEVSWYRVARC